MNSEAGAPFTDRRGEEHRPVKVALLVGQYPVRIEFRSGEDVADAIGAPEVMEVVTVAVYAQGAYDREAGRRLPVFFAHRKAAE